MMKRAATIAVTSTIMACKAASPDAVSPAPAAFPTGTPSPAAPMKEPLGEGSIVDFAHENVLHTTGREAFDFPPSSPGVQTKRALMPGADEKSQAVNAAGESRATLIAPPPPPPPGASSSAGSALTASQMLVDFFAEQNVCTLPDKLSKALRKDKNNPFLPSPIKSAVRDVSSVQGSFYDGVGLGAIVHFATIGSTKKLLDLTGAPTASNLDFATLTAPDANNVYYQVDCSGYFKASLQAAVGRGSFSVDSDAAAKMSENASLMVMRATLASPVAVAFAPGDFENLPGGLDAGQRLGLLARVLGAAQAAGLVDSESVTAPRYLQVVATAIQSKSNIQGQLSAKSNVGGSIGFAAANLSTGGGFSLSAGVSYATFRTMVLPTAEQFSGTTSIKLGELRRKVKDLFARSRLGAPLNQVSGKYVLRLRLPEGVCRLDWSLGKLDSQPASSGNLGSVEPTFAEGACTMQIMPSPAGAIELQAKTLVLTLGTSESAILVAELIRERP